MGSQQQASNTPEDLRDRWRTPQFVFDYLNEIYHFDVDLAASPENAKCLMFCEFVSESANSLTVDWSHWGEVGWLNPPYSNVEPFVLKAIEQARSGFITVLLIPSFNGSAIWEKIYDNGFDCNTIGRLSFLAGGDFGNVREGEPVGGNTSASCIVQIGGVNKLPRYLVRDAMK